MSNKTLKQRIAVVAASALTAGFLSVVAMPTANAALGTMTYDNGSTGIITAPSATITGTDGTASMTVDGLLKVDVATAITQTWVVSGGTITSSTNTGTATINPSRTAIYDSAAGATMADLTFKPNAAGTNMVISGYAVSSPDAITAAATVKLTVTVRAAGASGTFSLANSLIALVPNTSTTAAASDTAGAEVVSAARGEGAIAYELNDALGSNMPATTIVTATVTAGSCLVGLTSGTQTLPFVSGVAPDDTIYVATGSAPAAEVCTVSLAVNGVVASTKTFTFIGQPAKVTVSNISTAKSSTTGNQTAKGYFTVQDATGKSAGGLTVSVDTTKYGNIVSAITLASSTTSAADISLGGGAGSTPTAFGVTCTGVKGTQKGMRLYTTLSNGTLVYSDPFDISCYGGLYSYTASMDKASYTTGAIATLTISAKDSSGNPVWDAATIDNAAGNLTSTSITCGGQATAVTAPAAGDTFTAGVKKYTFTLGTTTGNYNCVVSLGSYTAAGTGNAALAAVTVPWTLASGSTEVSNADVLKSIVALIASINKQIQALQKLILKR